MHWGAHKCGVPDVGPPLQGGCLFKSQDALGLENVGHRLGGLRPRLPQACWPRLAKGSSLLFVGGW